MPDEKVITLSQFKTMVESFQAGQKKIMEVMNHRFDKLEGRMDRMKGRVNGIEGQMVGMREQIGLLLEGQTEIKIELRNKVDREEFSRLKKRVVCLERKVA